MSSVRVITLAGDPEREAALAARLSNRHDIELLLRCVDRIELLAALRGGGIDAIVSVGAPTWLDGQARREAAKAGVHIVGVVSDPLEADALVLAGASLVPADATVEEIIERCIECDVVLPVDSVIERVGHGRLIAVWGAKGSPGRTTVAIELAAELATNEKQTLLIDCDSYGGDVLQLLGIVEELPTIVWAARMAAKDELDPGRLALELRRAGRRGPVLLPGLPRAELWADVSDLGWRQLLTVARSSFEHIVCDVGFCLEPEAPAFAASGDGRNRIARETVRSADHVVAVCRADPVGIKNFLWSYESLASLVDEATIVVVANRVRPGEEAEVADILKRHAGVRPVAYVPDRPQQVARAILAGVPVREIDSRSNICAAVRALAATVGGHVKADSLMVRLAGRS